MRFDDFPLDDDIEHIYPLKYDHQVAEGNEDEKIQGRLKDTLKIQDDLIHDGPLLVLRQNGDLAFLSCSLDLPKVLMTNISQIIYYDYYQDVVTCFVKTRLNTFQICQFTRLENTGGQALDNSKKSTASNRFEDTIGATRSTCISTLFEDANLVISCFGSILELVEVKVYWIKTLNGYFALEVPLKVEGRKGKFKTLEGTTSQERKLFSEVTRHNLIQLSAQLPLESKFLKSIEISPYTNNNNITVFSRETHYYYYLGTKLLYLSIGKECTLRKGVTLLELALLTIFQKCGTMKEQTGEIDERVISILREAFIAERASFSIFDLCMKKYSEMDQKHRETDLYYEPLSLLRIEWEICGNEQLSSQEKILSWDKKLSWNLVKFLLATYYRQERIRSLLKKWQSILPNLTKISWLIQCQEIHLEELTKDYHFPDYVVLFFFLLNHANVAFEKTETEVTKSFTVHVNEHFNRYSSADTIAYFRDDLLNPLRLVDYSSGKERRLMETHVDEIFCEDDSLLLIEQYRLLLGHLMKSFISSMIHPFFPSKSRKKLDKNTALERGATLEGDAVIHDTDTLENSYLYYEWQWNSKGGGYYQIHKPRQQLLPNYFQVKFNTHSISAEPNTHYPKDSMFFWIYYWHGIGLASRYPYYRGNRADSRKNIADTGTPDVGSLKKTILYFVRALQKSVDTAASADGTTTLNVYEFSGFLMGLLLHPPHYNTMEYLTEKIIISILEIHHPLLTSNLLGILSIQHLLTKKEDKKILALKREPLVKLLKLHLYSVLYSTNSEESDSSNLDSSNLDYTKTLTDLGLVICGQSLNMEIFSSKANSKKKIQGQKQQHYPSVILPSPYYAIMSAFGLGLLGLAESDSPSQDSASLRRRDSSLQDSTPSSGLCDLLKGEFELLLKHSVTHRWWFSRETDSKHKKSTISTATGTTTTTTGCTYQGSLFSRALINFEDIPKGIASSGSHFDEFLKQNLSTPLPGHLQIILLSVGMFYRNSGILPSWVTDYLKVTTMGNAFFPISPVALTLAVVIARIPEFPIHFLSSCDDPILHLYQSWWSFQTLLVGDAKKGSASAGTASDSKKCRTIMKELLRDLCTTIPSIRLYGFSDILTTGNGLRELLETFSTVDARPSLLEGGVEGEKEKDLQEKKDLLKGLYKMTGLFYGYFLFTCEHLHSLDLTVLSMLLKGIKNLTDHLSLVHFTIDSIGAIFYKSNASSGSYIAVGQQIRSFLVHLVHLWSMLIRIFSWCLLLISRRPEPALLNGGSQDLLLSWLVILRKWWIMGAAYPCGHLVPNNESVPLSQSTSWMNLLLHLDSSTLSNLAICICICSQTADFSTTLPVSYRSLFLMLSFLPGFNSHTCGIPVPLQEDSFSFLNPLVKSAPFSCLTDMQMLQSLFMIVQEASGPLMKEGDWEVSLLDGNLPNFCQFLWKLIFNDNSIAANDSSLIIPIKSPKDAFVESSLDAIADLKVDLTGEAKALFMALLTRTRNPKLKDKIQLLLMTGRAHI